MRKKQKIRLRKFYYKISQNAFTLHDIRFLARLYFKKAYGVACYEKAAFKSTQNRTAFSTRDKAALQISRLKVWILSFLSGQKASLKRQKNAANPIRIGIVGLGRAGWGMEMNELIDLSDRFKYVAACDLIPERRLAMQERFPDCRTYESIDSLIADPEVELVIIATRSCDHFEHAKRALTAGKDVLIEKPMCLTHEQALCLKSLSDEDSACGTMYVRHNRRFENGFRFAKSLVDSGRLGRVYEIRLARSHYQRRSDWQTLSEYGGGQIYNWGPHIIDHALQLLESKPERIVSHTEQTVSGGDCADHVKIIFEGENGRIIDMEISDGCALHVPEYMIYGTLGACVIDKGTARLRYINPKRPPAPVCADPATPYPSLSTSDSVVSDESIHWIREKATLPHIDTSLFWNHLYASIREGHPFPITNEDAVQVIEIIEQAAHPHP